MTAERVEFAFQCLVIGLLLLLLCVNGWGCGGATERTDPQLFGWCCDGICGLTADEASLFETCECSGIVHPVPDTRGACLEAP